MFFAKLKTVQVTKELVQKHTKNNLLEVIIIPHYHETDKGLNNMIM